MCDSGKMGFMPTLGYSAKDQEASLKKYFYKRHAVGAGHSSSAKFVFFMYKSLDSIPNMEGCEA